VENLVENIEHIFPNAVVRLLTCEASIVMGMPHPANTPIFAGAR
jgi:hypothetical protein